jgi:DNA (cytosine-5)-methyltransferase 1
MYRFNSLDLLRTARARYTQVEIARLLEVDVRTVRRWEVRENDPPAYLSDAIKQRLLPFVYRGEMPPDTHFTFIDLFAGIGGISNPASLYNQQRSRY